MENYRLPKAESQRTALAQHIGVDGVHVLAALDRPDAPTEGKDLDSVQVLRQVWQQYYDLSGGKPGGEQARAKKMERESFVPRTTPKHKRAKSGQRHGWGTQSI